jgi:hypothetical protein
MSEYTMLLGEQGYKDFEKALNEIVEKRVPKRGFTLHTLNYGVEGLKEFDKSMKKAVKKTKYPDLVIPGTTKPELRAIASRLLAYQRKVDATKVALLKQRTK